MNKSENNSWVPKELNDELSPHTGLGREHWIDCAEYILGRTMEAYSSSFDTLFKFPKVDGKTYPQPGAPEWQHRSVELESIRRTSYLGIPLIHVKPGIKINNIDLEKYYIHHLIRLMKGDSPDRIPYPEELPVGSYQFTCELGGLAMELLCFPDVLWPQMTKSEQDIFANMLSKWAHSSTNPHNWRFFNISMLTFLKMQGYAIDDDLLIMHLQHILSLHSGDGWYHDGHFDNYTIYVITVYAIIWCRAYGYEHEPEIAARFDANTRELFKNYFSMFGRDGFVPMWGRSIIYRFAAVSACGLAEMMKDPPPINYGWARRIASGGQCFNFSQEKISFITIFPA